MRRIKSASLILPVVLVALAAWVWWSSSASHEKRGRAISSQTQAEQESSTDPDAHEEKASLKSPPTSTVEGTREAIPARLLVKSKDGAPLAGVLATWASLDPEFSDRYGAWPNLEGLALEEPAHSSVSDANGVIVLDGLSIDLTSKASVVWLTHPDHLARSILLEHSRADMGLPSAVTMEPSRSLTARVVDAEGHPVAGATIVELSDESPEDLDVTDDVARLAYRLLHRRFTTGASGLANLDPFPKRHFIFAELGTLRSESWRGPAPASVTLVLRSTFTAQGRVYADQVTKQESDWHLTAFAQRGLDHIFLGRWLVGADAHWGPARLPLVAAETYDFQLQGGTIAAEQVSVPTPAPDASVTVDFHPHPGRSLSIRLVGEDAKGLRGGTVSVNWNHGGTWESLERPTGADGIARFLNCEPGMVWVRARCSGHATKLLDPFDVSTPPGDPVLVILAQAGKIEGRCLHQGKPVPKFDILYWQGSTNNQNKLSVRDSKDGSFAIDEAPLGEVEVLAISEEYLPSELTHISVAPNHASSLVLDLQDALPGRGRVIDGLNGSPLPNAKVQLYAMYKNVKLRPWRIGQSVDANGSFEIAGFRPGENMIEVSAPGYATRQIFGFCEAGRGVEFDLVGLFGKQSIDVQLTSDAKIDFTQYQTGLEGQVFVGEQPFPADGHLRFLALDPGPYCVRVVAPDSSLMFDKLLLLPGKDVQVRVPLSGRHLDVEVVTEPGSTLPPDSILHVAFATVAERGIDQYYRVSPDGHVDVTRVEGSDVVLQVEESEGGILAVEHVTLTTAGPTAVRIVVGASSRTFRVVDASGRPVAGVRVTLTRPGDGSRWMQDLETNFSGECSIRGLAFDAVFVHLSHKTLGVVPGILVDLGSRTRDPIELVLAPDLTLRVVAMERKQLVPNLPLRANDQQGIDFGLGEVTSNADGMARWTPVGEGDYRIEVRHPGYWPSDHLIHLTASSSPAQIEVRRLGNVAITVKNSYENLAQGIGVDLYSVEEQHWVSDWISSEVVPAPTNGLTTGSDGVVRINALPNGLYRWRATAPGAEAREGEVVIAPQSTMQLLIAVP